MAKCPRRPFDERAVPVRARGTGAGRKPCSLVPFAGSNPAPSAHLTSPAKAALTGRLLHFYLECWRVSSP